MADASPDLALAEQIDAVGDQFERDFRAGQQPRLEQFLAAADEQLRPTLFRTLLELELELRQKAGEQPQIAEYEARFPAQLEQIRQAFEAASRPASMVSSVKLTGVDTSKGPVRAKSAAEAAAQSAPKTLGRFEILSVLGEGAFGTVYRARDPQLDREVAVKVPKFAGQQSREDRERFLREARAAANLHHPQICAVHEVGTIDGRDYIVLAFIDGKPLSKVLQSKPQLSDRQIVAVIRKLALALQEAHDKGIIHRDLKPANIMINRKGEPVIMDFGLARRENSGDAQISHSGQIMGTPAYMSPEQARGDGKAVGPASDIYSLGIVLYELLCGRRPFEGTVTEVIGLILHVDAPPPAEFRPAVDPRLQAICLKAIAKKPGDRYASMKDFATALADYVKAAPATTRPADAAKAEPESADELHTTQFAQLLAAMSSDVESKVERAVRRAGHPPKTPWWTYLAGSGFMGLVILLGVMFFIKSGDTTVIVQISMEKYIDDLKDPALSFLLDNRPIEAAALESPIELKPGEHELIVNRDGKLFKRFAFNVEIGASKNEPVVVQDVTPHQKQEPMVAQDVNLQPNQDPLIGVWEWGWGDVEPDKEPIYQNEVTMNADGTCVSRIGGLSGKWERSGNQVVINWANNAKDTVTVSKDGTKLDGRNKEGTMPVRGRKKLVDGWIDLFNGKDLTGWKRIGPADAWSIRDGALFASGKEFAHLVCDQQFQDFELTGEVYAAPKGNGGICFHVAEAINGSLQQGGYEFQVAGSEGDPGRNYTGGLYANWGQVATVRPPVVADRVWSTIRIRVSGNRLQGWVDDRQTFDAPGQPARKAGRMLTLQSFFQGGEVGYRNLRVRPLTGASSMQVQIPADARSFNGHSYKFFPEQLAWKAAKSRCEALGGHLVIVEDAAENAFVARLITDGGKVDSWIGATDEGSEGQWRWVDGRNMTWTNWLQRQKQPNNKGGVEHFGLISNRQLGAGGTIGWEWSDQPNESNQHQPGYVCEWDSVPGTAERPAVPPEQSQLIEKIQNMGGALTRDESQPGRPVIGISFYSARQKPDDALLGELRHLPNMQSLNLWGSNQVTNEGLRHLGSLKSLRSLDLGLVPIGDAGVVHLGPLKQLTNLNLSYTRVTDAAMPAVASLRDLQSLALDNVPITDEGLKSLGQLTELSYLNLLSTRVQGPGLKHLAGLPKLAQLWLSGSPVSDDGMQSIASLPAVSQLYLAQTKITDTSLADLAKLKGLTELSLQRTAVTTAGIEQLRLSLPKCRITWE